MTKHQSVDEARARLAIVDPRAAARSAGLVHVSDDQPGIGRRRSGKGFSYRDAEGKLIRDPEVLARIRKLAIPPAYTDVWICPRPNGHLQATGRDARGRKQYRYHPSFREVRENAKYEHMLEFAAALPSLRRQVAADMARAGLPREKVLATVVHLLETTMIRVGNADYARRNRSYGLTTLRSRHVDVEPGGAKLRFAFKGKSGRFWRVTLRNRRLAKIVRAIQELPGQHLFQYLDEEGARHDVGSEDVNDYLREISGTSITAKDFRTWAGTVLAATALSRCETCESLVAAKQNIRDVIAQIAAELGNTPTICRKCYIHPHVLDAYLAAETILRAPSKKAPKAKEGIFMTAEEEAVIAFLRRKHGA
ncbi:DNA topoisomerase IB [Sphingomonas sp. PR090111-T3T-6A]|uniref:DNA topoisomerase IB n=1 Tax=Sphingomonas sp. PR090111-T3T-6A TaxID=685778 RepID=UPI000360ED4C|nr:DNA topoisomerase IB [Sphingomonas sp. PR090111-T3T-6A]